MAKPEIIDEIINDDLTEVVEDMPVSGLGEGPKKILFGAACFVGGIVVDRVVVPGIKKLREALKTRKRHKELEEEILDESEVEFVED